MVVFAGNIGGSRNSHPAERLSDCYQPIRLRHGIHVPESYLMSACLNGITRDRPRLLRGSFRQSCFASEFARGHGQGAVCREQRKVFRYSGRKVQGVKCVQRDIE